MPWIDIVCRGRCSSAGASRTHNGRRGSKYFFVFELITRSCLLRVLVWHEVYHAIRTIQFGVYHAVIILFELMVSIDTIWHRRCYSASAFTVLLLSRQQFLWSELIRCHFILYQVLTHENLLKTDDDRCIMQLAKMSIDPKFVVLLLTLE